MRGHDELLSVERLDAGDLGIAARILAEAFADDPVLCWVMPKTAKRIADATAFFTFYLRRKQHDQREIFANSDRSAVAVLTPVARSDRHSLMALSEQYRTSSSPADYFRWIECFRPEVDHRYLEFIGISPDFSSQGRGTFLLKNLIALSAAEGRPVWCWSSNPRNLPFYYRLGFEAGADLRRDADTPPVTPLLRPVVP